MTTANLPPFLLETAVRSGQELGWRKAQFPAVLKCAAAEGGACIGGQFQWVFPDGTCEAYGLNADASPRQAGEAWPEFVARCEQQILEGFSRLVSTVNFDVEADNFEFLKNKKAQGIQIADHLLFVAYFDNGGQDA
jgi:hypothetical protein